MELYKDKMFFRIHVAHVNDDENVEEVCISATTSNPLIYFKDGSVVGFKWEELIDMAINFKKKQEKEKI